MDAPCLAHKFERLQSTSDGPRPDIRPILLHEAEVSPFKICVTLLLREHYSLQEVKANERTDTQRIAALRCLYDLTCLPDLTFPEFKQMIQDPENSMRPEVVQSVLGILQELDRNNAGFLNDFINTMLEIHEPSASVIILKKKIGKNGPFGRFVRMVLMSLRKMTYAQNVFVYKELCLYVGSVYNLTSTPESLLPQRSGSESCKKGIGGIQETVTIDQGSPRSIIHRHHHHQAQTLVQSLDETSSTLEKASISDTQIDDEDDDIDELELSRLSCNPSLPHPPLLPPDTLVFPSPNTSSVGIAAEVEVKTILSTPASITKPIGFIFDRMEKLTPYDQALNFNSQTLSAPIPNKDTTPKYSLDIFEQMRKARIESNLHGLGPKLFSNYSSRLDKMKNISKQNISVNNDRDRDSNEVVMTDLTNVKPAEGEKEEGKDENSVDLDNKEVADMNPKWLSRRIVESTIKAITHEMNRGLTPRSYSSNDVSSFISAAKLNPSSKVLLPQLNYLEYLNSLQIKDISRAHETLRTSFDLRIKPTTSELSKAIPYASYTFAVLYERLGYMKDATMFLEEAFQSGHSAGDETCLDYCHNLWSQLQGVPEKELTPLKDLPAKGASNLYTIKSIDSIFDKLHTGGHNQLSLLNDLWKCVPAGPGVDCSDIVQGEAYQMESLASLLHTFGWYKFAKVVCLMMLQESETIGWSTTTYCTGLTSLAHLYLLQGSTREACKVMDRGRELFEFETNYAGELFNKQFGLFQAQAAYLAYVPLKGDLLATLAAFDSTESMYWLAYNKMMNNDFDSACKILKQLSIELANTMTKRLDLKIRCLLLQAELHCLTNNITASMPFLFEAYDFAVNTNSDYFIVLALINLASVQHRLGLCNLAARTLRKNILALLRCDCPLLTAKFNLINIKLFLSMEKSDPIQLVPSDETVFKQPPRKRGGGKRYMSFFLTLSPKIRRTLGGRRISTSSPRTRQNTRLGGAGPSFDPVDEIQKYKDETANGLLELLNQSKAIYMQWNNLYRKKELLYYQKLIYQYCGKSVAELNAVQAEFDSIETSLIWSCKTCII